MSVYVGEQYDKENEKKSNKYTEILLRKKKKKFIPKKFIAQFGFETKQMNGKKKIIIYNFIVMFDPYFLVVCMVKLILSDIW